ncbi:hypothetical protein CAPGI0001_2244 [Capnocytophaga gingivalis ATCC 33624]|nr:hypothetical protein CAPGI0001_2244 [Capnocytophaga gingivalis ATCC 33624]
MKNIPFFRNFLEKRNFIPIIVRISFTAGKDTTIYVFEQKYIQKM